MNSFVRRAMVAASLSIGIVAWQGLVRQSAIVRADSPPAAPSKSESAAKAPPASTRSAAAAITQGPTTKGTIAKALNLATTSPTIKATTRALATTRPAPKIGAGLPIPAALLKPAPESLADLKALQDQVKAVVRKVSPAVVGLRVGGGQGSGVIISEDGYILTAGHVASAPGRDVVVILQDGKQYKGKSLGVNYQIDSGLVQITEACPLPGGKWPFAELGQSADLKKGQWCVALGHPGGFRPTRTAPLRLGRIIDPRSTFIRTDCMLVGGDSGGPLFDLAGRVIGIHSRIGNSVNDNMHIPADTYFETWTRLAAAEAWGGVMFGGRPGGAYLGIQFDQDSPDCKIGEVFANTPAEKAGLREGDVIISFDSRPVANFGELMLKLNRKKPGDEAALEVQRAGKPVKLKLTLGTRPAVPQ